MRRVLLALLLLPTSVFAADPPDPDRTLVIRSDDGRADPPQPDRPYDSLRAFVERRVVFADPPQPDADPPTPDLPVDADPPQPDRPACAPDTLAGLSVRGLTPRFSPGTTAYRIAPPATGVVEFTASSCDPAVTVFARSTPLARGGRRSLWVGDGATTHVVLYRNWREVGRYSIAIDTTLPPPPPAPGLDGLGFPGLSPAFDPRVTRYTAPSTHGDRLPLTVVTRDPSVQVHVQGVPVRSDETHHAWAPPGARLNVVVYRAWAELARYVIVVKDDVTPKLNLDLAGKLYVTGRDGKVLVVDASDETVTQVSMPAAGQTVFAARSPDHARVYVTSPGPKLLTAIDTETHTVAGHRTFGGDMDPEAVVVRPDSQVVTVADAHSPILLDLDVADLAADPALTFVPWVHMPTTLTYRPGTMDLYVTDFFSPVAEPERARIARRRLSIDWEAGAITQEWAKRELPFSHTNEDGDTTSHVAFLPKMGVVVAPNSRGDELVVLHEELGIPLTRTSVGHMPFFVTADPKHTSTHGRVFLPTLQSGVLEVYAIDAVPGTGFTLTLEAKVNPCTGGWPNKVEYGAFTDRAWVLCTSSVVEIDTATLAPLREIALGSGETLDLVWAVR